MLSVVHTGVTLVSSDISSGFASSKRKVFVEQTVCTHFFFHSRTLHLDIIKVFTPTDAHVFFKRIIKVYIKTAPTCSGVITIIRERTIRAC